jgi:hypothetical protein
MDVDLDKSSPDGGVIARIEFGTMQPMRWSQRRYHPKRSGWS